MRSVRRLAHEIELIENGLLVFIDDFDGPQAAALLPITLRELRQGVQHFKVAINPFAHAGTEHLDHDFLTLGHARGVYLGDRGRGERRLIECRECLLHGTSERALDDAARLISRKRRHAVLQLGKLIGNVARQQVAPRGYGLAEFDEHGPELLECEPDAFAATCLAAPLEPQPRRQIEHEAQRPVEVRLTDEIIERVPQQRALDLKEPHDDAQLHGLSWLMRASRRSTSSRSRSASAMNCSPSARGTRSARS